MKKRQVVRPVITQPQDQSIRYIPLTQGQVAVVDYTDYEWLMQRNWHASYDKPNQRFYVATRTNPDGGYSPKKLFMHNELMRPPEGFIVDHINRSGLDNRRTNMRTCTHQQNCCNRKKHKGAAVGYKGVTWHKGQEKFNARIQVNGKLIHIGSFDSAEDAYEAYKEASRRYHGRFSRFE